MVFINVFIILNLLNSFYIGYCYSSEGAIISVILNNFKSKKVSKIIFSLLQFTIFLPSIVISYILLYLTLLCIMFGGTNSWTTPTWSKKWLMIQIEVGASFVSGTAYKRTSLTFPISF